ncbi:DUF192 domain-containing protein [Nanoarchaeota archaeon]
MAKEDYKHHLKHRHERHKEPVKKYNALLRVLLLGFVVIVIIIGATVLSNPTYLEQPSACFVGKKCVELVDVMDTPKKWGTGLMGYANLEPETGMLFVFDKSEIHGIWMRNMTFPIDVVWLDYNKQIIYRENDIPPCYEAKCPVYGPTGPSKYVIELPANYLDHYMITGGYVDFFGMD